MFVASVAQVTSSDAKSLSPREEISLHRLEGFGRGMAEALSLAVDVIATAYSGNTDFCTGPLAYPCAARRCRFPAVPIPAPMATGGGRRI